MFICTGWGHKDCWIGLHGLCVNDFFNLRTNSELLADCLIHTTFVSFESLWPLFCQQDKSEVIYFKGSLGVKPWTASLSGSVTFLFTWESAIATCWSYLHILWILLLCCSRCPELQACISADLWCDSIRHCPSGYDEAEANCDLQFGMPLLYVAIAAGALLVLMLLSLLTACLKLRQHRRSRRKKRPVRSDLHNHNHNQRYHEHAELYLDGKDSICWQDMLAVETTVWRARRSLLTTHLLISKPTWDPDLFWDLF